MANPETIIRPATLADISTILEIENLCFDSDQFTKKQFVYLIVKSKGSFYLVQYEGKTVAYLSLLSHAQTNNLRIYSIAVSPEVRGKKIGTLLINKAIEYARLHGNKAITLEVKVSNEAAIGLYEKMGFVKKNIKRCYYHDGSDAYYMVMRV